MGKLRPVPVLVLLAMASGCGVPGSPATWSVREGVTITPETTVVPVSVMGSVCDSGQPDRVTDPLVEFTPDTVTVIYRVEPPSGDNTCIGTPGTDARLLLAQPLGDRELVDGGCDGSDGFSCVRWSPATGDR